jgi:hypothetical protein
MINFVAVLLNKSGGINIINDKNDMCILNLQKMFLFYNDVGSPIYRVFFPQPLLPCLSPYRGGFLPFHRAVVVGVGG